MNSTRDPNPEDLRYAEYVLGVLDADARAQVERELRVDPRAAEAVARWQRWLTPLMEDLAPLSPPEDLWQRIVHSLGWRSSRPAATPARIPFWDRVAPWRNLALGAASVAAACIIALVISWLRVPPTPTGAGGTYMASAIRQDDGRVGWTATMDLKNARIVVVPARPGPLPSGRAPELWLIPPGAKPVAIGMIATDAPTAIALNSTLLARLGPSAALAVSAEPPGGSPTGQPTGPVIAKGAIQTAAERGAGQT